MVHACTDVSATRTQMSENGSALDHSERPLAAIPFLHPPSTVLTTLMDGQGSPSEPRVRRAKRPTLVSQSEGGAKGGEPKARKADPVILHALLDRAGGMASCDDDVVAEIVCALEETLSAQQAERAAADGGGAQSGIRLVADDGESLVLSRRAAQLSATINDMFEDTAADDDDDAPPPMLHLPRSDGATVRHVAQFCERYLMLRELQEGSPAAEDEVSTPPTDKADETPTLEKSVKIETAIHDWSVLLAKLLSSFSFNQNNPTLPPDDLFQKVMPQVRRHASAPLGGRSAKVVEGGMWGDSACLRPTRGKVSEGHGRGDVGRFGMPPPHRPCSSRSASRLL